jgi:hypothetical protein
LKLFKNVKKIYSRSGELHFSRFAILESKYFSIYIHNIYQSDKDMHLHNHPWKFLGIILKGKYTEKYINRASESFRVKKFLYITFANRNYFHKIDKLHSPKVVSLFFTFGKHKDWGYLVNNEVIDFNYYRFLKHNKTRF